MSEFRLPRWLRGRSLLVRAALVLAGVGVSTAALGLPWDIDMADGRQRKAYSLDMGRLPDGVVAQPSMTSPRGFVPNHLRGTPDGEALANPLEPSDAPHARGKRMYETYCTPCHGDGKVLGPVAGDPVPNQAIKRIPGVSYLAGSNGVAKTRSDGYVYLTIRNGGTVMPSYGWALSDDEIWSVVSYVRTLEGAAYVPPTPAPAPAAPAPAPAEGRRERRERNP